MIEFSALAYAAIGGLYALLTILLLTSSRGSRIGLALIAACVISALWGVVLALQTNQTYTNVALVFVVEVLRGGAWISFLVVLTAQIGVSRLLRRLSTLAWGLTLLAGIFVFATQVPYTAFRNIVDVLIPGGLVIALVGLVLIEQLYRNSPHESRWGLKALVLGVGGIFAYDLFLYSQAMLFGVLDSNAWMARGAVNLLFVPLIAVAARRNPNWDLDIFVSRQVVFYSTTLMAVGLYLLLMSLGGYALVIYGGNWGPLTRVVFFVGALVVLAWLLFSSALRAKAKVFLSKHFYRNKYDHREEWQRLVATLSAFQDSSTLEVVIKAMAQIVGSPSGFLWMLDDGNRHYRFAASYNTMDTLPDISTDDSLTKFVKREFWLVDLNEYKTEPDRYGDLDLPKWLLAREDAWLMVPLSLRHDLIGFILVNKPHGTMSLNYEDRDLLKTVGSHAAVHLAQDKSDKLLAEARQFEAYNRLTAFLMHDLNNLVAQQSLIVENAKMHKRNPEFVDDTIRTIANSVERMKRVMAQLRGRDNKGKGKPADVRQMLEAAVRRCADRLPKPELRLHDLSCRLNVDQDQFVMVLCHLIRNAQDATPEDGAVEMSASCEDGYLRISVTDSGIGMSREFIRERLFRPFDSTKGNQGMGIGAYQVQEFITGLNGKLLVDSEVSKGTTITLVLRTNGGESRLAPETLD